MIKITLLVPLAKKNMTQKDLAKATNIREAAISKLKRNQLKEYPAEMLNKICEVLECDISDIMHYEPDND